MTANLIVVEGPAGSGKTKAVEVLSDELGFTLIEWEIAPFTGKGSKSSDLGQEGLGLQFIKFLKTRFDVFVPSVI